LFKCSPIGFQIVLPDSTVERFEAYYTKFTYGAPTDILTYFLPVIEDGFVFFGLKGT